ncbi:general transcription factor IIH subunit 5 [Patagioenas fasciata monilis]|uniref:General transcription and DNA repair factor IIH subunit TFB5 n=1 Tax=Patagioenas fasciata monilis TaxID=372326 RepID=A0A1V4JLB3_PATFA|nr:general transcription factor IIH subunit 5 [Patagioenas fasciata monilis]
MSWRWSAAAVSPSSEQRLAVATQISAVYRSGKMVNVLKGVLIECDPAMKQFLLYLDESNALGKKFIIQDLDETHVFVLAELVNFLQERVGELMDQNSFPITQK